MRGWLLLVLTGRLELYHVPSWLLFVRNRRNLGCNMRRLCARHLFARGRFKLHGVLGRLFRVCGRVELHRVPSWHRLVRNGRNLMR